MTVKTSFDDALIDDSLAGESFDNEILSLIAENSILRADTDQVLDNLRNIVTSIGYILTSLAVKFGSYVDSTSDVEDLYSNLGADEEVFTKASDALSLEEYFLQVMGFNEDKQRYQCFTAAFIQLLNDLSNSVLTCSPGMVSSIGSSGDYLQYGEREEAAPFASSSYKHTHHLSG